MAEKNVEDGVANSSKTSQEPLVSIVMPAYNSGRFISESIESVLAQTYVNWELLIIDDISTDNTRTVCAQYIESDRRIKYFELSTKGGAGGARNKGITEASGRYLAFLDSDDIWLPEKLSVQISQMQLFHSVFSYTAYWKMSIDGVRRKKYITVPRTTDYANLLNGCVIGCLTVIIDLQFFGKQHIDEYFIRNDFAYWLKLTKRLGHEDYSFWLKLVKFLESKPKSTEIPILGINVPLAVYRLVPGSLSNNKFRAAMYQWQVYRQIEKISFLKSLRHFFLYALKGIIKYLK